MKNKIVYIIVVIFSVFLGSAMMYALIYYYPNVIVSTVNKEEKTVTVIDKGIAEGIKNVSDSVVVIESYQKGQIISMGSGFIYKISNNKAYIMTNHHVIDNASEIKVTLANNKEYSASLVGSDEYTDIAVLTIKSNLEMKKVIMGNSSKNEVGDTVFTIGSPMGKEYAGTVTRGILSGKNRMVSVGSSNSSFDCIANVMQTDAAINPGNSGGPLCNVSGEVIGINSMKIVESSVEGIGFAIPIEDAIKYATSLEENGKILRAYIGVSMINATEKFYLARFDINIDSSITSGVVIAEVQNNSPASKVGLKVGDVIYGLENNDVENIAEFRYYLYQHSPGDKIKLLVYRDGNKKEINITLAESK